MGVIVTLCSVNLKGKVIPPNTKIRVDDEQNLIDKGYARRLTREETRLILNSYVQYAVKVFAENTKVQKTQKTIVRGEQESLWR
jgi:hypothetical protein